MSKNNSDNEFYLTQCISNIIISTHYQYKIIEIFLHFVFHSDNLLCI